MNRRALLKFAPAGLLSLPAVLAPAKAEANADRARMMQVIADLEAVQGWETSNVAAAKAFAAWQMRKAMGLDLPAPNHAQMHVDGQSQAFAAYRRSYQFERDTAAGTAGQIHPSERNL